MSLPSAKDYNFQNRDRQQTHTSLRIRKVKCDETKPNCTRCTGTGRKCDGYAQLHGDPSFHGQRILNTPDIPKSEARALDFFHQVAGPVLAGQSNSHFWTHQVAQLSHREPAVRHALVAISSLYENFQNIPLPPLHTKMNSFAVRHYNTAMAKLVSNSDEAVALFMSVLFTCVEFLQGNEQAAINHCRHGILMLNAANASSAWARNCLLPIFCRLSIFPFFFGSDVSTFPQLVGLNHSIPSSFSGVTEAQFSFDTLLNRWIRFVRAGDEYRLGASRHKHIPTTLRMEQRSIENSLIQWYRSFSELKSSCPQSLTNDFVYPVLQMRYLVARIWVKTALERGESVYDMYLADFQSILDLASHVMPSNTQRGQQPSRPRFVFEMGFLPLLYFVVIKCRSLKIRLAALQSMKALAVTRESLWEVGTMYSVGRALIEIEHAVDLDKVEAQSCLGCDMEMPPENMRVWENMLSPDADIQHDGNGGEIFWRKFSYFLQNSDGELDVRDKWIHLEKID